MSKRHCKVDRKRPLDDHPPDRRVWGIEAQPCFPSHFHYSVGCTPHQVSIHLWGGLGRLVWRLMRLISPAWRKDNLAPAEGYWRPILVHYVSQEARHFSHLMAEDRPGRPTHEEDNAAFMSLWKRLVRHGIIRKNDDMRNRACGNERWLALVDTWTTVRGECDRDKIEGEATFRALVKVMQQCHFLSENPEELTPHTYRALYHAWRDMDGQQVIETLEQLHRYAQWQFMRNAPDPTTPPESIPGVPPQD